MIISLSMSGLALLAATAGLAIAIRNEKRSKERNAALINYIDTTAQQRANDAALAARQYVDEETKKLNERIAKLEQGITPDYEQAKAAADAVNNFSKGISNILGFDPMEALKTDRRKREQGEIE